MKITVDTNDLLATMNNKSFIHAANINNQSSEAWGLPYFKRLTFKTESEIWRDEKVKKAVNKVKEYANKKDWSVATPQQATEYKQVLFQFLRDADHVAKGLVATVNKPKFVTVNGITILVVQLSFKQAKERVKTDAEDVLVANSIAGTIMNANTGATYGAIMAGKNAAAGAAVGGILGGIAGGAVSGLVGYALARGIGELLLKITNSKKMGYWSGYVPFVNKNNKLVWKFFGSFLVGDIKADDLKVEKVSSKESLYLDSVDFSTENEDCPNCEGNEFEVTIPVTQDEIPETPEDDEPPTTEVVLDSSDEDGSFDNLDIEAGAEDYFSEESLYASLLGWETK